MIFSIFRFSSPKKGKRNPKHARARGFTLIELMVSVAIFVAITTVTLVKVSEFNSTTLITNLAYEIAIAVRQAQIYGLSVHEATVDNGGGNTTKIFDAGYGIHFETSGAFRASAEQGGDINRFVLFQDLPESATGRPNQIYNGDGTSEVVEGGSYVIPPRYKIVRFCGVGQDAATNAITCSDDTATSLTSLDITFVRPDPKSTILGNGVAGLAFTNRAIVCISSPQGRMREIDVYSIGQISIPQEFSKDEAGKALVCR